MVARNKTTCLALIWGSEGSEYTNDPNDNGGPTRHGITLATLTAWRNRNSKPGEHIVVTAEDVKNLTIQEAQEILWSEYAMTIRFDDLPSGVDYLGLDFAVNSGPGRSVKVIQNLVGATPDGIMGVKTIAAIKATDQRQLIEDYCDARLAFMKSLSDWSVYKNGWTNRVERVRKQALSMLDGSPVEPSVAVLDAASGNGTAKASPTKVSLLSSGVAVAQLAAGAATVVSVVPSIIEQLNPLSSIVYVGYAIKGLTLVSVLAGLYLTLNKLRSGQATV